MINQRNCPNCGAPYDTNLNKCPYCNTSYYDMSALDLLNCEPFYLKIKTEMNGIPCYITQLVRPINELSMEISSDTVSCVDCSGTILQNYISSRNLTTTLAFQAVISNNYKNLCTIEMI